MAMVKIKKLYVFTEDGLENYLAEQLTSYENQLHYGDDVLLRLDKPVSDFERRFPEHHIRNLRRFAQETRKRWAQEKSERLRGFKQSEDMPIKLVEAIGEDFLTFCRDLATECRLPLSDYDFHIDHKRWCFKGLLYEVESGCTQFLVRRGNPIADS